MATLNPAKLNPAKVNPPKLNPMAWPLALRVPLFAVLLMLVVSGIVTDQVLSRLIQTQNRHLTELSDAYLDGLSSAVLPHVLREDVWEIYDGLDRAAQRYKGLDVAWTTVTNPTGAVLASTAPRAFPLLSILPADLRERRARIGGGLIDDTAEIASLSRELYYQGRVIGTIYAEVRIEAQRRERGEVLATLILTNAGLTLVLATIGYLVVHRMLRPVGVLSDHMRVGAAGHMTPVPARELGPAGSEFGQLFRRYNSLLDAVGERERLQTQLAEEERLASLGRLASGMAHEINNPLGGMLNAVAVLQRHGDRPSVREPALRLIERGLLGIRDIVGSSLATYRHRAEGRALIPADLDDLGLLVQPEIIRKGLRLEWHNGLTEPLAVPAGPVRDAALNLLLNACAAAIAGTAIRFSAEQDGPALSITVADAGPGVPSQMLAYINADGAAQAPLQSRSGLGLWMVKRLAAETGGAFTATNLAGGGAVVRLVIPVAAEPMPQQQEATHGA